MSNVIESEISFCNRAQKAGFTKEQSEFLYNEFLCLRSVKNENQTTKTDNFTNEVTRNYLRDIFNYIVMLDTKISLIQKDIFRIEDKINNIKYGCK